MKLEDLDKPKDSGKGYYWKMKTERAKMDRKEIKDHGNSAGFFSFLFFAMALIFTILTYFIVPSPAPIWMFIVTGGLWASGSAIKLVDEFSIGVIFGILNALMTFFVYFAQQGNL